MFEHMWEKELRYLVFMVGEIVSVSCNVKYKSTVIYKISCRDETVQDVYIGQTTNFERRKWFHARDSITSSTKLYEFIRAHGGWDNWEMNVLCTYTCKNRGQASRLEWIWWTRLGGALNTVVPGSHYIRRDKRKHEDFEKHIHDLEVSCTVQT
jgi:hypothetical protein